MSPDLPEKERRTPTDRPPPLYVSGHRSILYYELHRTILEEMQPRPFPKFDQPPPRHVFAWQCDRAAEKRRAKLSGGRYNRVQICVCGRSRVWPFWSKNPTGSWLGQSGRRGREGWYKRQPPVGGPTKQELRDAGISPTDARVTYYAAGTVWVEKANASPGQAGSFG